jgi:hypothetical protein
MELLTAAYIRRKRFEAQLQAAAVVNKLGQAMGGAPTPTANGTYNNGYREISPEEMLQRIG